MLVETGKKISYLSPDTGKESGNISTPDLYVNICHGTLLKSSCFVRTARDAKISVNTSLNPHIKYGIFRKAPFRLSVLELRQMFNSFVYHCFLSAWR